MIATELALQNLLVDLTITPNLLLIQDLDGVCMGLVRDPLTRQLGRHYIEAARQLAGHFQVLTNGEHTGQRGVNGLVERSIGDAAHCQAKGLYLPGLAAGGVQLQDRQGRVSHPGVSAKELAFLAAAPQWLAQALEARLSAAPYHLDAGEIARLLASSLLDNPLSPTLNLNAFHHHWHGQPHLYRHLQDDAAALLERLLRHAEASELNNAFFVHYAPNLGHDAQGHERLRPASGDDAGTTDLQFMLRGAVKEAGVLMILNRYYGQLTGDYPLGEGFNVRQAPTHPGGLLQLAVERFDPALMPRLIGVGDTLSSSPPANGQSSWLRGGSDRGFLTLVQQLGNAFARQNRVLFVDSSQGEVRRPGIDCRSLRERPDVPWLALRGISDENDPLHIDALFTDGHEQYVQFFCALAAARCTER